MFQYESQLNGNDNPPEGSEKQIEGNEVKYTFREKLGDYEWSVGFQTLEELHKFLKYSGIWSKLTQHRERSLVSIPSVPANEEAIYTRPTLTKEEHNQIIDHIRSYSANLMDEIDKKIMEDCSTCKGTRKIQGLVESYTCPDCCEDEL